MVGGWFWKAQTVGVSGVMKHTLSLSATRLPALKCQPDAKNFRYKCRQLRRSLGHNPDKGDNGRTHPHPYQSTDGTRVSYGGNEFSEGDKGFKAPETTAPGTAVDQWQNVSTLNKPDPE